MADSNQFFDELAKKSAVYKLGLVLLPILLIGLLYWQFFYNEMSQKVSSLESTQRRLLSDQRQLDKDLEDKKKLLQRMKELEQSIRASQRALPTQPELSAFFDFLQRRAGEAGVNIRKWDQLESETVDVYVRVPVEIEVSGDFLSIVRYFYLLGPRVTDSSSGDDVSVSSDRIVSVEDLFLGEATVEDGESRLVGRFIASTFHLDDKAKDGPNAAQPGAAAAARPR